MGDIALRKGGSVDPKKYQDEVFELYSIPAFDAGAPEVVSGSAIGSAKKAVRPNDVMISRIVPHIRRACVVGPANGHRQIASGEWIIFRDERIWPKYLRWVLVGDVFHSAFMRTVSGVGGSLLRARPAEVFKIQIRLPPLAEQKRIAGILDAADALRAKRGEALTQLDTLLQSTFLDMFGDPVINPMGWEVQRLADVFWLQEGPGVRNWQFKESGIKLLNVSNILKSGELDLSKTDRHLSTDEVQEKYSHFLVDAGDLVIASSGISIDEDDLLRTRSAFVRDEHLPLCMNTSTVRFKATDGVSDLRFLQQWLQSHEFRRQITREVTGSAQKNFGPTHLKRLRITLPPLDLLRRFGAIVESVEQQKARQRAHLAELDTLFASLQSRAFRGDL